MLSVTTQLNLWYREPVGNLVHQNVWCQIGVIGGHALRLVVKRVVCRLVLDRFWVSDV